MRSLILLCILLTVSLFPQLKEMEVNPTTQRGAIPVNRDNPDKAAIFFYTQFDDLQFWSNYGIVDIKGDPAGGKYIVIVEPVRQTIEVRRKGYKTEMIKIESLQPRDVLYYEVLPKKEEGIQGITEVGVTVIVSPADASIMMDGKPFPNNITTKLSIGKHNLLIEKPGYTPYSDEIDVTPEKTLFNVSLSTNDPVSVIINSTPADAEIFIDGLSKGKTRKALFLYPGSYDLRLSLSGYLSFGEKITITTDEKGNNFQYTLTKNTGKLKFEVSPAIATVRINKEVVNASEVQELTPGTYQIEVEATTYYPYKGTVEIKLGETKNEKITLTQKAGKLQFAINPPEAECVLTQNGVEKYRWTGLKIFSTIAEGTYDLSAKAQGYKTYTGKITIRENQTTIEDIQMTPGSDSPEGMVWVDGKNFSEGNSSWSGFFIGRTEVTQELWESVMGDNPSNFKGNRRPVESVTWYDAVEFCNKLSEKEGLQKVYRGSGSSITCDFNANGYRLPTEAEWEYAAKGGNKSKGYDYSGSDDIDDVAWYGYKYGNITHDVATKKPNEIGIYDMSGNVWEWCWDLYSNSGSYRVLRGGSWNDYAEYCRVAYRCDYSPVFRFNSVGFRLARTR